MRAVKSETENSWHSLCMDRSPRVVEYVEIWLNSPFNQHVAQRRGLLVLCFTIILGLSGMVSVFFFSCPLSLQLLKLNLIYTYCTTHLFTNNITYTLSSWKSVFLSPCSGCCRCSLHVQQCVRVCVCICLCYVFAVHTAPPAWSSPMRQIQTSIQHVSF